MKNKNTSNDSLDPDLLELELFAESDSEGIASEIKSHIDDPDALEGALVTDTDKKIDLSKLIEAMYHVLVDDLGEDALDFQDINSKKAIRVVKWIKKNLHIFVSGNIKHLDKSLLNKIASKLFLEITKNKDELKEKKPPKEKLPKHTPINTLKKDLISNIPSLTNLITRELGLEIFNFTSRKDPRVKEITNVILRYLNSIADSTVTYQDKKELTIFCLVEILKKVKGKSFLQRI